MVDTGVTKKASIGFVTSMGVVLVALAIGCAAGALMSRIAPPDKFSWAGLAFAPVWILLEIYLEAVLGVASISKVTRVLALIAVLGGFYLAWFMVRAI